MKNIFIVGLMTISLFSCKRECDCQPQVDEFFSSQKVYLPVKEELVFESGSSMKIYIDDANEISVGSDVMTVEQIDSAMAVLSEADDEYSQVKVYPSAKSDFGVFNEILKLSLKHDLKIKIGNK